MADRARQPHRALGLSAIALLAAFCLPGYLHGSPLAEKGDLDCPETSHAQPAEDTDHYQRRLMEWVLNGQNQGAFMVLRGQCGEVLVRKQDTRAVRLCELDQAPPVTVDQQTFLRLDLWPDITLDVDESRQLLTMHSPGDNFCRTRIDLSAQERARLGEVDGPGGFLNYRLSASRAQSHDPSYGAFLGAGVFSDWGVLQSQHSFFRLNDEQTLSQRIATFWKFDNPDRTSSYRVGDAFAGRVPWRSGAALGGIQITRNYATRPDLVTRPVVDFEAIIDTQAQLLLTQRHFDQPEIIGNAYFGSSYQVQPGPVDVVNQPLFNNTVQTLTVREADGTISVLEIPSYFTVGQLRQGFDDFEIAMGVQRQGAGDDYDILTSLFSYRRGVSRWLTLGVGAAASQQQQTNGGIFAQTTIPRLGAVQTHLATSRRVPGDNLPWTSGIALSNQYRGYSYALVYEQQANGFNPSLSRDPENSDGFRRWVGSVASRPWRGVGLRFGVQHLDPDNAPIRTAFTSGVHFSWPSGLRIRLSHTERLKPQRGGFTLASLEMPLSSRPRTRGGIEASRDRDGGSVVDARVGLLGGEGYPSVQLRHRLEGGDLTALTATVERPFYGAFASAVDSGNTRSFSAGVAGGIVTTREIVRPTRFASGGFALVDLGPELGGVRVNGIPTDKQGRALLVRLPAFQETALHVNQQDLPYNTFLENSDIIAAPKDLSLVRVSPDFQVFRDALLPVMVVKDDGRSQPLSPAAQVFDMDSPEAMPFPVGLDGQVYIRIAKDSVNLLIIDRDIELCEISLAIPEPGERTPELAPVTCSQNHQEAPPHG